MGTYSNKPGMGAIPYNDPFAGAGTTFRLWAGSATKVYVAGTFNNWSTTANALYPEVDGYWSVDVPGVLPDIGNRYRYVLQGSSIDPANPLWKTDPYCKSVQNNHTSDGGIISAQYDWSDDQFSSPAWNDLVIYELHIGSFNRATALDGTFNSVIQKLDYLAGLGINAIEMLPVTEFPDAYSLGYDPAYPFDIESSYGSPDDFKDFIKAAHSKGIAVIMDIVLNHFGPNDLGDCLWQFDGWSQDGFGGIYFYNDWRAKTDYGINRPDFGRGEVRQFLRDNVLFWLEEYHVDGLRFDSTVNIRNGHGIEGSYGSLPEGWSLLQWFNDEIDARMPWKIAMAEDLQGNAAITQSTAQGGAGFDSQWDSLFYGTLNNTVIAATDEQRDMQAVAKALLNNFGGDADKRVVYINNHDECAQINGKWRLVDRIWLEHAFDWAARKRYIMAAAIVFTVPGIPLIFQGDEFLAWGQWDPQGTLDWSLQTQFSGILNAYRDLIQLRRNWYNNTAGLKGQHINVFHINDTDKLIAYHRWQDGGPGDDVLIVANFANNSYESYSIGFPRAGNWYVRFNSDWSGYSSDFADTPGYGTNAVPAGMDNMPFQGNIGIAPYSVLILSQ